MEEEVRLGGDSLILSGNVGFGRVESSEWSSNKRC